LAFAQGGKMIQGAISADSHITEPPNCYVDYIDPKYRDDAPYVAPDDHGGERYVIPGLESTIPLSLVAAAGIDAQKLSPVGKKFSELHRSGWDATRRAEDQDRDGVASEIIYASVGMALCSHADWDYKHACFEAYNRWLAEFCADAPGRVHGLAQTAIVSVEQSIKDFIKAKEMGFVGMMMPGDPQVEDYDHPMYDPLWECAVDLDLPLSFHILSSKRGEFQHVLETTRGSKMNGFLNIIRSCQDIVGLFTFGGVFERHPKLKMVCAEADAGWVPHYMYRTDHFYERHGYWMEAHNLSRLPSEYIRENIWFTFQDDAIAFQALNMMNPKRLCWASDFPHSDSTWPDSQKVLAEQTKHLTDEERDWVTRTNVAELYNLPTE
jgi:uncharacterized protein